MYSVMLSQKPSDFGGPARHERRGLKPTLMGHVTFAAAALLQGNSPVIGNGIPCPALHEP